MQIHRTIKSKRSHWLQCRRHRARLVSGWKHCVHIILNWKTSLFISYTLMLFCLSRFLVYSHFIFTHASCFATFVFSVVKKIYWFPFTCTLIYNIAYCFHFISFSFVSHFYCIVIHLILFFISFFRFCLPCIYTSFYAFHWNTSFSFIYLFLNIS